MDEQQCWKDRGFENEEKYNEFLRLKMDELMSRIVNDKELLNVFKRLNDK